MTFDNNCYLWPNKNEHFFTEIDLKPIRQSGNTCVITSLAILTGKDPEQFTGEVNTQDPISWSKSLGGVGMKLSYCPTDARKLKFYIPELVEMNDLFTLCYYTTTNKSEVLGDPDNRGWVCSSHIVVMCRDMIIDPAKGAMIPANTHHCNNFHTKRIFRVVPENYHRGL